MGLTAGLQVQATQTQDNIKTDVEEIGSENVDWIRMFQDRYKRKTFAKTVMNLLLFQLLLKAIRIVGLRLIYLKLLQTNAGVKIMMFRLSHFRARVFKNENLTLQVQLVRHSKHTPVYDTAIYVQ
jgi:hypothetical protein